MKKYIIKKIDSFKAESYALVNGNIVEDEINKYARQGYKFEDLTTIGDVFYVVMSCEDKPNEE